LSESALDTSDTLAAIEWESGGAMETWNREELYAEIWEQPLVTLAPKYGISAVALGKVCRKLQIPLPGHGYWVKKEFGKSVKRLPLPVPLMKR
jgi:hypothetical protein